MQATEARKQIRVGLVGYGAAGRVFHAPVIEAVPDLRLTKVVERRSDESRRRYPSVTVVRDAAELFDDDEIDLVVVATPNDSHFDLALRALEAGKHVVVDKPFTTSSAEAEALIDLARAHGRIVTVNHNRRWDGDFLTVGRLLDSGLLGSLVEYESRFDRFRPEARPGAWREGTGAGAGLLFDIGSHLVDQALVLFGLPLTISAELRIEREGVEAVDSFDVVLEYDGPRVTLGAGMLAREPGPRFSLRGTRGSFVKYGLDPQEEALAGGRTPREPGWGQEPRDRWGALDVETGDLHVEGKVETLAGAYPAFYTNVAEAITGRAELAVTPESAWETIRVIELAIQSSAERRPIEYTP